MKTRNLLIALFSLLSFAPANAQTDMKPKAVILRTGVTIQYAKADVDSARILFTPEGDSLAIKVYLKGNDISEDYLYSQLTEVVFWGQEPVTGGNVNRNDVSRNREGWRLEFPHFYEGTDQDKYFEVTKSTADYGITYSLEWDGTRKANRWTCYEMYAGIMAQNVGRKDNFREDPDIPAQYRTTLSDYSGSGYSRGHLCPSADRLCSREQNSQTFFLSNMQPQIQSHNGGVWAELEGDVRTWAGRCDTLYVVKGATIDDAHVKTYTSSGLIVPAYFYMALLSYTKATDTYRAVGIWSPHEGGSTTEYITIDELEKRTGIDFFCNLPDDIEAKVEAEYDSSWWQ